MGQKYSQTVPCRDHPQDSTENRSRADAGADWFALEYNPKSVDLTAVGHFRPGEILTNQGIYTTIRHILLYE
jgi:hypothetical protein